MNEKVSTVVIGGGIAGLTAAFTLARQGHEVCLLEASDRVGGAIHTVRQDGYLVEAGPNTVLDTSSQLAAISDALGISEDKIYAQDTAKIRYVVREGRLVPLPMSPFAFLTTPLFSIKGKLRLFAEPFAKANTQNHEESIAQFACRRLGQELLDYALNPFIAGIYAGDPQKLSLQHAFPRLYTLERENGGLFKGMLFGKKKQKTKRKRRIFTFRHGLDTLTKALARDLDAKITYNAPVYDISRRDKQWQVSYRDQDERRQITCATIIYAAPAHQLAQITIDQSPCAEFAIFDDIYYPPLSVLALGFHREDISHPLNGFGFLVPEIERREILGVLFNSSIFPERAPQGKVLLTVFIGGARQPHNANLPIEQMLPLVYKDLKQLLGARSEPEFLQHHYWPRAIPQYQIGYGKIYEQLQQLEQNYPGLYFCGNYAHGISVPDTVEYACVVAEKVICKNEI